MKKLIILLSICLLVAVSTNSAVAQKQYAFGSRTSKSLTSATTVTLTPVNTFTLYTIAADTSITFHAITSKAIIGDKFVLKISGNTRMRQLIFGNYLNAANDSVSSTKIKLFEFIYNGTDYDILSKQQTN